MSNLPYEERYDLEREISWQMVRALQDALEDPPEIPATETLRVEVEIRVSSDTWPGTTESGRSRSRRIGYAICLYSPRQEGSG